jgi:hypothetical protein
MAIFTARKMHLNVVRAFDCTKLKQVNNKSCSKRPEGRMKRAQRTTCCGLLRSIPLYANPKGARSISWLAWTHLL